LYQANVSLVILSQLQRLNLSVYANPHLLRSDTWPGRAEMPDAEECCLQASDFSGCALLHDV